MARALPTNPRAVNQKPPLSQYVRDLEHADPAKRRRAIMKLGESADPEALPYLGNVYRSDPSVELRELARKAGVYIKQQETIAAEVAAGTRVLTRRISPEMIQRARAYTDEALTFNLEGHNEKAVYSLSRALQLNPTLVDDTYFCGIASTILNLPKPEALEMLKSREQRGQYAKTVTTQRKTAAVEEHMEEARRFSWRGMGLELALFALICALGPVILMLVVSQGLSQILALTPEAAVKAAVPAFVQDLRPLSLIGASISAILLIAVSGLVLGMVNLFGQAAMVHGMARFLLRGKGTFGFLLSKMLPLYTRYTVIVCLVGALAVGMSGSLGFFFLIYAAAFGLVLFTLFTGIKLLSSVGEAYHSSAAVGCTTIMISLVGLAVVNAAAIGILSHVLTGMLSGLSAPT